jgi:pimeloyl-ACP methyl ester carboxylesterase
MAAQKHTITLPNTTVHFWIYNPDAKQTLVAIHGFRGTHHGLQKIAENLPNYRLVIPDLPGFGESTPFTGASHDLASYVQFVQDFITALHLPQPPVLLGHSFGSIICAHVAATAPGLIDKLVLINPIGAPALKGPRGILTRLAVAYYWLGRKLPAKASLAWLSASPIVKIMSVTMAKTKDSELQAYIHDQHRRYFSTFADPQVVAQAFKTSISHDVSHVIDEVELPTLLIVGELDDITPLEKQKALHAKAKQAELAIITEVGHLIHYEKAEEAASAIHRFLTPEHRHK